MLYRIPLLIIVFFLGIESVVYGKEEKRHRSSEKENIYRNLYIEMLGTSNFIGLSYDSRIKPGSRFGYRIGISYAREAYQSMFIGSGSSSFFAVPLEANYLYGKRKSKLETGLGLDIGICQENNSYWSYNYIQTAPFQIELIHYKVNHFQRQFGYYFFSNIGYRYQASRGFLFRFGINASFNLGDKYGVRKRTLLYPYISFGYTFKN